MKPSKKLLLEISTLLNKETARVAELTSMAEVNEELREMHQSLLLVLKAHQRTMRACGIDEDIIFRDFIIAECPPAEKTAYFKKLGIETDDGNS